MISIITHLIVAGKRLTILVVKGLFGDEIYRWPLYKYYKRKRECPKFLKKKINLIENFPVVDLYFLQKSIPDYSFVLYDGIVRYITIYRYLQKSPEPFELYDKMNILAGDLGYISGNVEENDERFHNMEKFKTLIDKISSEGFDKQYPLICDRNGLLIDGSHRLALALYLGTEYININILTEEHSRRWNINWFWANGFHKREIGNIVDNEKEIRKKCLERIGVYYVFLFHPAYAYWDEIVEDISNYDSINFEVCGYSDYLIHISEFIGLTSGLYAFDCIEKEKLKEKQEFIIRSSALNDKKTKIREIRVKIKNPEYHLKSENGMPQELRIIECKRALRLRYRDKVKGAEHIGLSYNHDIIMHSTDNYLSNNAYKKIKKLNRNISLLFQKIKIYDYVLCMQGEDQIPEDFPINFYLNKDFDIFITEGQIQSFIDVIYGFCIEHFSNDNWIEVSNRKTSLGYWISVTLKGFMIVRFDVHIEYPGLKDRFVRDCILNPVIRHNVKCVDKRREMIIRLAKYIKNPSKIHHANYILKNCNTCDISFDYFVETELAIKTYDKIVRMEDI